jgi:1-acyl-sn-glycerol-3-phosphate acyltransferase
VSWARAAAFNVAFVAWTAFVGVFGLPFLLAPRRAAMRFGRFWSEGVVMLLRLVVGLDYRVVGLDCIPAGGCIVAMKHQSAWDAIVMSLVLDDPAPVVKRELLLVPIYGWYAARAGSIGIDRKARGAAVRQMLAGARQAAAERRPIVIFPQGTRVPPGASGPYQPGVFALYQALSLPLVPAAVNSGLFWGRRSFMKRPGQITLEFLEPIPPGWPRRRLMEELEQRIETATAMLESEAGGGGREIDAGSSLRVGPARVSETNLPRRR